MESITSRDNRLIKEGRRLLADAKYRRQTGLFLLEGARLCADAARSGVAIRTVLVTARRGKDTASSCRPFAPGAAQRRRMSRISEEISRHLGDTASPQGIFCICKTLDNRAALDTINRMGRYIALEDMQDPANLGTVVRTAEALGADGLLLSSGCCDLYNPKVLRGSMGGGVPPAVLRGGGNGRGYRRPAGARDDRLGLAVVDPAATPVHKAALGPGSICIIGNEGNGLRPETAAACRGRLTICDGWAGGISQRLHGGGNHTLGADAAAGIIRAWSHKKYRRDACT